MVRPAGISRTRSALGAVGHEPLRVRVARILRAAILDGVLEQGEPIVEQAIAAELGVSRAPVREAIHTLAQEGLIETVAYKGSTVRHPTPRDVEETYSLRAVLERFALERIGNVGRIGYDAILEDACARMEDHARDGDVIELTNADLRFHRRLIELADHDLLLASWHGLEIRIRLAMRLRNAAFRDPATVAGNHRAILEAFRRGDDPTAARLVREHVRHGAELVEADSAPNARQPEGDPNPS